MGYFFINPKQGESFSAKWKDEKGTEHTTALPAVKSTGVSIQVSISGDRRNFVVTAPPGIHRVTRQAAPYRHHVPA